MGGIASPAAASPANTAGMELKIMTTDGEDAVDGVSIDTAEI
jgi:hypothetical protein